MAAQAGDLSRTFLPRIRRELASTVDGMSSTTIRPAFSKWPEYNRRLRDVVAAMTDEQLATRPAPERWPLWATVGHTACQRELNEALGIAGLPQIDLWD